MITPAVGTMTTRRAILATLVVAIAAGGVMVGLALSGVFERGTDGRPPSVEAGKAAPHQTMDALGTVEKATARALPTATSTLTPQQQKEKIQAQLRADPRVAKSCPEALPASRWVASGNGGQADPKFGRGLETSHGYGLGSNGIGYLLAAGSPRFVDSEPERWFVMTLPEYPDSCASRLGLAPEVAEGSYAVGPGPVTMTAVDGDIVTFTKGDGTTGRLNFVTGAFE